MLNFDSVVSLIITKLPSLHIHNVCSVLGYAPGSTVLELVNL